MYFYYFHQMFTILTGLSTSTLLISRISFGEMGGYHLLDLEEHQRVMMLSVLDVVCQ